MGHMLIGQDGLEKVKDLAVHGAVIAVSAFLQQSLERLGDADLQIANLHGLLRLGYQYPVTGIPKRRLRQAPLRVKSG